jgi:probable HAF family extracellular repeat protein
MSEAEMLRTSNVPYALTLALLIACRGDPVRPDTHAIGAGPSLAKTGGTAVATMLDVGTLGGSASSALSVSATGEVGGWSSRPGCSSAPFIWASASGMVELPALPGWRGTGVGAVYAVEGNIAVGNGVIDDVYMPAARWERNPVDGTWTAYDMGTLGGDHAFLLDIAVSVEATIAVGWSWDAAARARAIVWAGSGEIAELPVAADVVNSFAYGVNTTGTVVGAVQAGSIRAAVWTRSGVAWNPPTMLPTLSGYADHRARAINATGDIVGYAENSKGTRAVRWVLVNGSYQIRDDIGTLGGPGSIAYDINDRGQVVGESKTSARASHGFIWEPGKGIRDLGVFSGYTESIARSINNAQPAQIAGHSHKSDGSKRAVRWQLLQ